MILSRVDEIVELAKVYMIAYKLKPLEAIEYAIKDIEQNGEEKNNGR